MYSVPNTFATRYLATSKSHFKGRPICDKGLSCAYIYDSSHCSLRIDELLLHPFYNHFCKISFTDKGMSMKSARIGLHLVSTYDTRSDLEWCPNLPMSCDHTSYLNTYFTLTTSHSHIWSQQRLVAFKFNWKKNIELRRTQSTRQHARNIFNLFIYITLPVLVLYMRS